MSKIKTSIKIADEIRASVCADVVLFMYLGRKDYNSPTSEICRGKDGWNELYIKTSVLNFKIPDIPYMQIKKAKDNDKFLFKFDIEHTFDTFDYTIVNRSDLSVGEKILLLVVSNWSALDGSDFWNFFFKKMPIDFIKEKLTN